MATPDTRQKLIDYCLRALGHPVIEINVDDDQLEDRVDEAIQFYQEFHGDAVVRNLLSCIWCSHIIYLYDFSFKNTCFIAIHISKYLYLANLPRNIVFSSFLDNSSYFKYIF